MILDCEFASYTLSVLARNAGFDEDVSHVYERNLSACRYEDVPKPTLSNLCRWVRTHHRLSIEPYACGCGFSWQLSDLRGTTLTDCVNHDREGTNEGGVFNTYEQAQADALLFFFTHIDKSCYFSPKLRNL